MGSSSTRGMWLATQRIRSSSQILAITDCRYAGPRMLEVQTDRLLFYSCSPHLETFWPNTDLMVSCGSTLTALEGSPLLRTIRFTWFLSRICISTPILQAVVTDFNNHRLLVIKADFQGAQVRHFYSIINMWFFFSVQETDFTKSLPSFLDLKAPRMASSHGPMGSPLMMKGI